MEVRADTVNFDLFMSHHFWTLDLYIQHSQLGNVQASQVAPAARWLPLTPRQQRTIQIETPERAQECTKQDRKSKTKWTHKTCMRSQKVPQQLTDAETDVPC